MKAPPTRPEPSRLTFRAGAESDVGKVRADNQDRLICDDSLQLFGVADGVGGLPFGGEAAEVAVAGVRRRVAQADDRLDLGAVTRAVNQDVLDLGMRLAPHAGIATTLTWGMFRGNELHLAHVGDSRCYCLRSGALECLTSDHSVANEAKRRRERGETVFFSERDGNAITRCIGQPSEPEVDQLVRAVQPGDRYLFCTDGICRALAETDIRELMSWVLAPQQIVGSLIQMANARGGRDNATAVLIVVGLALGG